MCIADCSLFVICLCSCHVRWARSTLCVPAAKAGMHLSTLQTKLKFFHYTKLSTHNAALYRPMQRQTSQQEMASRLSATGSLWTRSTWRTWCASLIRESYVPQKAVLPGKSFRKKVAQAIRMKKADGVTKPVIKKRPSSRLPGPPLPRRTTTRRTPFNLPLAERLYRPVKKGS